MRLNKFKYQSGSTSLIFAFLVLPTMLLVSSIAIDVGVYVSKEKQLQNAVDEAVLLGARYLPDTILAKNAVNTAVLMKVPSATSSIDITDSQISISAQENFIPYLATFFQKANAAPFGVIPITAFSKSKISPVDLFVALDRGTYVSPVWSTSAAMRFHPDGDYPVPAYLMHDRIISYSGLIMDPGIALEQCFNDRFSKVKLAGIRAIDSIYGISSNRFSLNFFPGSESAQGVNSSLTDPFVSTPVSAHFWDTHLQFDTDHYVTINEEETYNIPGQIDFPIDSLDCAAIAQDPRSQDQYMIPMELRIDSRNLNQNIVNTTSHKLETSFPISYREVIWSRVARKDQAMDFISVLNGAEKSLFSSSSDSINRGNLSDRTQQIALIVSPTKPYVQGIPMSSNGDGVWSIISAKLQEIRNIKLKSSAPLHFYYLMTHEDYQTIALVQSLFDQYKTINSQGSVVLSLTAFGSDSIDSLINTTIPTIFRGFQRGILSN